MSPTANFATLLFKRSEQLLQKGLMMNQQVASVESTNGQLMGIQEGMPVFDLNNRRVGTVKHVQFADDMIEDAFVADDLTVQNADETVRRRLLKAGFIKINTGLLRRDQYATSDMIEYVGGDGVQLNVLRERLMKL